MVKKCQPISLQLQDPLQTINMNSWFPTTLVDEQLFNDNIWRDLKEGKVWERDWFIEKFN